MVPKQLPSFAKHCKQKVIFSIELKIIFGYLLNFKLLFCHEGTSAA
jgi:hypothetical protein